MRLLGAGRAPMAAKDLHYDGNRRFSLFLSERTAGRILTELKQKGLCGPGDARPAAASPLKRPAARPLTEVHVGVLITC